MHGLPGVETTLLWLSPLVSLEKMAFGRGEGGGGGVGLRSVDDWITASVGQH
jgi:hypothetical protein